MQRIRNVDLCNLGDVAVIGMHYEQSPRRRRITLWWLEAIAIADEGNLSARYQAGREIDDAVAEPVKRRRWIERIAPIPTPPPVFGTNSPW